MEKITIHRALSELKLIDARISKLIGSIEPSGAMQKGKLVNNFYEKSAFESDAKSKYQSFVDLVSRKSKIKSAIVSTNSTTKVVIDGVTMTIADAITNKTTIQVKRDFIDTLKRKHNTVKASIERSNKQVEDKALQIAQVALQKDNVKLQDSDATNVTTHYIDANIFSLVDPLQVESLVDKMEREIDGFESEVDSVLSEINAVTYIEF